MEGKPIYIYGDGTQQRSFTYVKDVVKANLLAAISSESDGKVYNCASGIKVTIKELFDLVCETLDKPSHPVEYRDWMPGDIKVFDIDNSRIRADLGIDLITDFQSGLQLTVNWAKDYYLKKGGF
jgi:nucleoside-diphosphate-sugar epimerase